MTKLYKTVSDNLANDFAEIHKLDTLQTDFEKLKFLRDLPLKLAESIKEYEEGKRGIEVFKDPLQNYFMSTVLLEKYKSTASFNALYSEISANVDKIKFLLKKDIINFTKEGDYFEYINVLISLKESKVDLREHFIKYIIAKLKIDIRSCQKWAAEPTYTEYEYCYYNKINMNAQYDIKADKHAALIDIALFSNVKKDSLLCVGRQIITILEGIEKRVSQYSGAFIKEVSTEGIELISLYKLLTDITEILSDFILNLISKVISSNRNHATLKQY